MQEEVRELVGDTESAATGQDEQSVGQRARRLRGDGQKVPVRRLLVRTLGDKEVRLGNYEMCHRAEPLTETVWEKLMLGLSTRKYGQAVRESANLTSWRRVRSTKHFIEASRAKLQEMMERRLDTMQRRNVLDRLTEGHKPAGM